MNNSYILIIIVVLVLMCLCFRNKPKSTFGASCVTKGQSKIWWNNTPTCYGIGNHGDLSSKHPALGDMVIQAGNNTVQFYGLTNFRKFRGSVKPGETKKFRGWPWSVKVS